MQHHTPQSNFRGGCVPCGIYACVGLVMTLILDVEYLLSSAHELYNATDEQLFHKILSNTPSLLPPSTTFGCISDLQPPEKTTQPATCSTSWSSHGLELYYSHALQVKFEHENAQQKLDFDVCQFFDILPYSIEVASCNELESRYVLQLSLIHI